MTLFVSINSESKISEAKDNTPTNKLPSSKAMNAFVSDLPEIKDHLMAEALGDFDEELASCGDRRSWLR